jgi:Predicted membrane protein (DUF2085)
VHRAPALLLAAIAVSWVALVLAAPLALAHGYTFLPAIVYQAAGLICHQRPERSFHLAGIQLPVCARCFGLYASGAAGSLAACLAGVSVMGGSPPGAAATALGAAALPTALTLAFEWGGLWHPGAVTRAIAAVPLGAVAGWLVVRVLQQPRPHVPTGAPGVRASAL